MSGVIDSATAIMAGASRRLEATANNVANVSTPAFKRQLSFERATTLASPSSSMPTSATDFSDGALRSTKSPLDFAISGPGFFVFRSGDSMLYSRSASLSRRDDGAVVNASGQIIQQADGGDLVLGAGTISVNENGDISENGRLIGRFSVVSFRSGAVPSNVDGATFTISAENVEEVSRPVVRQGMTEASNVIVGDEMITMMAALRQAESGARIVQTYDDLFGKAISTFGQSGR